MLSAFATASSCNSQGCNNPGLKLANAFGVLPPFRKASALYDPDERLRRCTSLTKAFGVVRTLRKASALYEPYERLRRCTNLTKGFGVVRTLRRTAAFFDASRR